MSEHDPEEHTPAHRRQKLFVPCPTWHNPLCEVVADGLIVKCPSCRRGFHHIQRAVLEHIWAAIERGLDPEQIWSTLAGGRDSFTEHLGA